ncbi:MAG TPA: VOC family protein [Burkholderiales bacterium]|nr:VOC family protein [Burkholderiales bacterium]
MKKVKPVPDGYHTVTPYLACADAAQAIAFYKKAFGAKELLRVPGPGGKIGHAELRIGDSRVMLADEYREMDFLGPLSRGGSAVHLHIYMPNADKVVERAVEAGAKVVQPLEDKFYGDRTGSVQDPFGHVWHIATHVEDVPPRELEKRAEKMMKDRGA